MTLLSKRLIAIALSGALVVPAFSAAQAGPRDGWRGHNNHYHNHQHHHHNRHKRHRNNDNVGAAVAAGVIGLAAGAILLGATQRPSYTAPPRTNYYPPAPAPVAGPVGYQPWSPAWYQYCTSKYRSFNPSTGTYTTYRGVQRFCQ